MSRRRLRYRCSRCLKALGRSVCCVEWSARQLLAMRHTSQATLNHRCIVRMLDCFVYRNHQCIGNSTAFTLDHHNPAFLCILLPRQPCLNSLLPLPSNRASKSVPLRSPQAHETHRRVAQPRQEICVSDAAHPGVPPRSWGQRRALRYEA
jgi:hypothetical protein